MSQMPVATSLLREVHCRWALLAADLLPRRATFPQLRGLTEVRLVGLVDSEIAHARTVASSYGISNVAARVDDMLNTVGAIDLATPSRVHSALAKQLPGYDLDLLYEKPMVPMTPHYFLMQDGSSAPFIYTFAEDKWKL